MSNPHKAIAALAPALIRAAGRTFAPVKMGHLVALDAAGNPLSKGEKMTALDLATAAALFALPSPEARALAADPPRLHSEALALLDEISPADLSPLATALFTLLDQAMATCLAPSTGKGGAPGEATAPTSARAPASVGASPSSPTLPPKLGCPPPKPSTARPSAKSSR
jgi:hypothetical protein